MRRRRADLVGGEDEDLVLDRAGAQQHLPVVPAGGGGEGRGDGEEAGAAQGEDAEQLREAQVVADGETKDRAVDGRRDDLLARLLEVRLAVGDAADVDVEHVDLAVGGEVGAVGADQDGSVEGALVEGALAAPPPRSQTLPASRWMPRSRAQARAASRLGPSSGSAPASSVSPSASRFHFSGSATSSAPSAAAARTKRSAVATFLLLSSVELSCTTAARNAFSVLRDRAVAG